MITKRGVLQLGMAAALVGMLAGCAHKKPPPPPAKPSGATTQALANAEQCISQAQQLGVSVAQAQQTLDQAKKAAEVPNNAQAQSLAGQVCQETDSSMNQYYLAKARKLDSEARQYANLSSSEQSQLQQGESEIANSEGKQAYNTLSALMSEIKSNTTNYTVSKGDNLWNIAKKPSIYGNPFEWPLIYMANSQKIKDPDLIYPGQDFEVWLNPLKTEWKSASKYAKTRGPWRHGQALSKDHAWLQQQQSEMNTMSGSGQ